MKVPKLFTPKKNLDKLVEDSLNKANNQEVVSKLLETCDTFVKMQKKFDGSLKRQYVLGASLAKLQKYDKKDLEDLSKLLFLKPEEDIGLYISALINHIIKDGDKITLNLKKKLDKIGAYMEKGTLVINGDAGILTGFKMKGGTLIIEGNVGKMAGAHAAEINMVVEGDAGTFLGYEMISGKITIKGKAEQNVGYFMRGGEIDVYGKIESITKLCEGKVYNKGKLVHNRITPKYQ